MSLSFININMLNDLPINATPFPWCRYQDLIFTEKQQTLATHYPKKGFTSSSRFSGDKKHYRFNVLPLIYQNDRTEHFNSIDLTWQSFVNELCSDLYIQKLLKRYEIDIKKYKLDVGCFRFQKGDWVEPHVDHEDKLLTQLFYFNTHWDEKWGGLLLLHTDNKPDHVFEYCSPSISSSIALKRTTNAWHSVTALTENSLADRLTVQLEVWKN